MKPPETILGVEVIRVVDVWYIDDDHGSRVYCKVETQDGREVTLLRVNEGWKPMLVTSTA